MGIKENTVQYLNFQSTEWKFPNTQCHPRLAVLGLPSITWLLFEATRIVIYRPEIIIHRKTRTQKKVVSQSGTIDLILLRKEVRVRPCHRLPLWFCGRVATEPPNYIFALTSVSFRDLPRLFDMIAIAQPLQPYPDPQSQIVNLM